MFILVLLLRRTSQLHERPIDSPAWTHRGANAIVHHDMLPLSVNSWLLSFSLDASLHDHVHEVIASLPDAVRHDFVTDPAFTIFDYEPGPRAVAHIPVGMPSARRPSRSVVLKRTLRHRPHAFVRYVIAHELAHAHLH